jgi:fluoroacetyl-CoA thioesterase
MEIWNAPVGYRVDLGEMPAPRHDGAPAGLDAVGQVTDIVVRYLTSPSSQSEPGDDRRYLESLSWHSLPLTSAPLRLGLSVIDHSAGDTTLRLHGVDPAGDVRIAADLRCRRSGASGSGTGAAPALLTVPVIAGDNIRRSYPVEAHMLTHHIPDAPGVLTTPNLIMLMEVTAAAIVRPRLVKGAAAVGTWIGVRHTGSGLLGQRVDVDAVVVRTGGRRITFDVNAYVGTRRVGDGQVGFTLIASAH